MEGRRAVIHEEDGVQNRSENRLLSLNAVAEITDLSLSTIRREIQLRHLACHRIGRVLRVSQSDLNAWLAKRRRGAR
jgi:excisionase family DNA binding protein